jgi:hypothetical protein
MQGKAHLIVPEPMVESVTLTMSAEEAKMLYKFVCGTTSNSVIEATGLNYDDDSTEIYAINDVLFKVYDALLAVKELDLPEMYYR